MFPGANKGSSFPKQGNAPTPAWAPAAKVARLVTDHFEQLPKPHMPVGDGGLVFKDDGESDTSDSGLESIL